MYRMETRKPNVGTSRSLAVPVEHSALASDFLLQLNHAIHKSLCCRRATRDVHVHRNDAVATTNHSLEGIEMVRMSSS